MVPVFARVESSLRSCYGTNYHDVCVMGKASGQSSCPFCGVPSEVPHETQEGRIAALQAEIGRVRGILSTLKPADVDQTRTFTPREADECVLD